MKKINFNKPVLEQLLGVIGSKKEFNTSDIHVLRMSNGVYKTAITYQDKTVLFMAKKFTDALRSKYYSEGNIVKGFVVDNMDIPIDEIKWSTKPTFEYHDKKVYPNREIVSLFIVILQYTDHDYDYIEEFEPVSICDSITFNMKNVLKKIH